MGLYLYGCSGQGKVVLDILSKQGIPVTAFVDDRLPTSISHVHNIPILWASEALAQIDPQQDRWIVTIGDNRARQSVVSKLSRAGHQFGRAIHPSSQIAMGVEIGAGSVVMANAVINTDAKIGRHTIINTGATVDHDCVIADYAHIAPGSTLCGQVSIGSGTLVGAGSSIIPGKQIGDWTICGAGSVVVTSLPSHSLAYGCPAKVIPHKSQPAVTPQVTPPSSHQRPQPIARRSC